MPFGNASLYVRKCDKFLLSIDQLARILNVCIVWNDKIIENVMKHKKDQKGMKKGGESSSNKNYYINKCDILELLPKAIHEYVFVSTITISNFFIWDKIFLERIFPLQEKKRCI